MKNVNALKVRNQLGKILDGLDETGEPVLISKGRKVRAVLITPEQFERRFLDYQVEDKKQKLMEKIGADALLEHTVRHLVKGLAEFGVREVFFQSVSESSRAFHNWISP